MFRIGSALAAALALGLGVLAPAAASAQPQELDWRDCGDGMRCATLTVPIDWGDPDGPKTTVDLAKMPAKNPDKQVGNLVVNTGGPTTTIQAVRGQPATLSQLTNWFDVVMIDPRGFGDKDSESMRWCETSGPALFGLTQLKDKRDWDAYAERNAEYDAGCRKTSGAHYNGYTSWQIAHDLDALRASLGDEKLRYLGNSYGTVYGQAYAELFGENIEHMYLEGIADHTQAEPEDWLVNYAKTDEQQLGRFAGWCAERTGCHLHGENAIGVYDELLEQVRKAPLPAPSAGPGKTVDEDMLVATVREGLNAPYWPNLARALAEARDGDAGRFLTDVNLHPQEDPPGSPGSVSRASLCHDFMPTTPGYREFREIESRLKEVAPRVGWMQGRYELARCLGIPRGPAYPPHPLRAKDVPPVLLGIGEYDNNTNNLGAQHVADQFPGGRALWHGDGHAAYLLQGGHAENSCLRTHVNRYLVDGTMPPAGLRCPSVLLDKIPDRPAPDGGKDAQSGNSPS